jgi:hypothetical protein
VDWIEPEPLWLFDPRHTDSFVALKRTQAMLFQSLF